MMSLVPKTVWLVLLVASYAQAGCKETCSTHLSRYSISSSAKMPYWRSTEMTDIGHENTDIETVVLFTHGASRDGDNYFCIMEKAVREHFCGSEMLSCSASRQVYVVAPQFYISSDNSKKSGDLCWSSNSAWMKGNKATSDCAAERTASFEAIDLLLNEFKTANYPNLKRVIVAGHSGGGQTVSRYALGSNTDEKFTNAGITVDYFVANPSSSPYFDDKRPEVPSYGCDNSTLANENYNFYPVASWTKDSCPEWNTWKYGLDGLNTYMSQRSTSELLDKFQYKSLTLISGNADNCCECNKKNGAGCCSCVDTSMDTGCEAMLGGICRMQRLHAWKLYLKDYYGHNIVKQFVDVPHVAHDACIYKNNLVTSAMFE